MSESLRAILTDALAGSALAVAVTSAFGIFVDRVILTSWGVGVPISMPACVSIALLSAALLVWRRRP